MKRFSAVAMGDFVAKKIPSCNLALIGFVAQVTA
ncbi:hypothetical protein [Pseudomonas sp. 58 R 3]|nr:hypothetical protein [Pseudomonas sp. 58 R 3]